MTAAVFLLVGSCGIKRPWRNRSRHPSSSITATNFGRNRMGDPVGGGPHSDYAKGDPPEFVAGLILEAVEEGKAQYFANDRLRQLAGA